MRTEEEIIERIKHIKTLSEGYGKNSARIHELEWVLKINKAELKKNHSVQQSLSNIKTSDKLGCCTKFIFQGDKNGQ